MKDKDPFTDDDCGTKFDLPRAIIYPVIALLIVGAILIFGE